MLFRDLAVGLDAHEDTERGHDRDDGTTAVTHHWQRDTHDRQDAGDHAHVHEKIEEEGEAQASREQARIAVLREIRDQLILRDARGRYLFRLALRERQLPGGISLITTVCALVAFALLAMLPLAPFMVIWLNKLAFPNARKHHSKKAGGQTGGGVLQLLRGKNLRRIYGVSVLSASIWNIFLFLMPIYGAQIGLSASTIGMIIGSFSFGTIVVRVLVPLLTRRFTPWQLLIMALVFASTSFLGFPAVTGAPMLMLFSFWLGMGLGLSGPLSLSLLHDASPPDRIGEVVGLRVMLMNGSQTAVPLFAGAIGAALGVAPVFWVLAATLLGGSYAVRHQWHRRKA